jgi:hypothetical protein
VWSKDLINEQIALLQEIRDKIGELTDRRNSPNESVVPSGGRGRNGSAGQSQSDLSNLARSLEGVLGSLGRVVPGLSALASSIRAVRTSLEGIGTLHEAMRRFGNGPLPAGPGAGTAAAARPIGSPREDVTGSRRRWNQTIVRAAEIAAAQQFGAGIQSRAAWVRTVLSARQRQEQPAEPRRAQDPFAEELRKVANAIPRPTARPTSDIFMGDVLAKAKKVAETVSTPRQPSRPAPATARPDIRVNDILDAAFAAPSRRAVSAKAPGEFRQNDILDAAFGIRRAAPVARAVADVARVAETIRLPVVRSGYRAGTSLVPLAGGGADGDRLPPGASHLPAIGGQYPLIPGRTNLSLSPTNAPWVRVAGITTNPPRVPSTALAPRPPGGLPIPAGLGASLAPGAGRIVGLSGLGYATAGIGLAVLAGAAAAYGATVIPPKMAAMGERQLESQRYLAGYDAKMAATFAGYDIRAMYRNRQIAALTADSTSYLARATADLKDSLVPQKSLGVNLKNLGKLPFVGFGQGIADVTGPMFNQVNSLIPWDDLNKAAHMGPRLLGNALLMMLTGKGGNPAEWMKILPNTLMGPSRLGGGMPFTHWIQQSALSDGSLPGLPQPVAP